MSSQTVDGRDRHPLRHDGIVLANLFFTVPAILFLPVLTVISVGAAISLDRADGRLRLLLGAASFAALAINLTNG